MTLNYTKDLNRVSSRCPMYPTPPNMSTHDKHNEFAIDLFCKMQHNYINKKSWARKLCHVSVNLQNKKSSFVFSITNVKIYHKLLVYRIVLHFTSLTFLRQRNSTSLRIYTLDLVGCQFSPKLFQNLNLKSC